MYSLSFDNRQHYGLGALGIDPATLTAAAAKLVKAIANATYTDGIFIRYRDKCFNIIFANFPQSVYDPILAKHRLGHKYIPERKIGNTYAEEFGRLHDAIAELLNTRKAGWGNTFKAKSAQLAQQYISTDPDRAYKGAPDEALAWVLANPNAVVSSNSSAAGNGSNAPDTAEASFNITPNVRMLLIAGGVLALGGITYLIANGRKKSIGSIEEQSTKKSKKRQSQKRK